MSIALPAAVSAAFVALSIWHFYMAFTGFTGESRAVPSVDGEPLFVPSKASTLAVGIVLGFFALLVAAKGGIVALGVPEALLTGLCGVLAIGLLARAVGDFRYVGFFKRVRGTPFASMDSLVYSPLCVLLSAGVAAVALRHAA